MVEVVQPAPKKEWPKYLWGPDGRQARFDSPADIPREYFPTLDEARAYAERKPAPTLHLTEPAALSASAAELDEFRAGKEKQAAKMAKARAARKPKVE
mgnify:CR=1 FL=1